MQQVTSTDGTTIAYTRIGAGPPLILVDGALCYRDFGPMPDIAQRLSDNHTVYFYDRRGRGESGNTEPFDKVREIEDIAALLAEAGGRAFLFGISSGAALALEAANALDGIEKLALYEAPLILDTTMSPLPADFRQRLQRSIDQGRPGDAVKAFMKRVGTPGFAIVMMRFMPMWKKLTAVGPTLPHDISFIEPDSRGNPLPEGRWPNVGMPTLAIGGGKSPDYLKNAMKGIAANLPDARYLELEGQTHMVKPEVLVPALKTFFRDGGTR